MNSISVIITSAHEPQTVGRALKAILDQDFPDIIEILVVAPDKETFEAAKQVAKDHPKVKLLQDSGMGKPTALNSAFKKVLGEILVLTDGDVYLAPGSLRLLLDPFKDSQVGGTCGRPVSTNPKDNMFGFWSHFLTDSAHQIRLDRFQKGQFIELSGYLLAIRKNLIKPLPASVLADDSYLSHLVAKAGFQTFYTPEAKVFVKYPTTLTDWFKQKRRSSFEYWQKDYSSGEVMRSPFKEAVAGLKLALVYPKNIKEVVWLKFLFLARISLWLQIFFTKINPFSSKKLWQTVKSTK